MVFTPYQPTLRRWKIKLPVGGKGTAIIMDKNMTFEEANSKLEALVKKMEGDELSLKESMDCYEQAFELLSFCYEQLDACKGRIMDINERIAKINADNS